MIATVPLPMNYSDWKEECVVACVYVRECMCVCHRQLAQKSGKSGKQVVKIFTQH